MDLEVVGRHVLLFDDDSMAAFTNSSEALVEWNSLSIDRYDVRHLLTGPLPSRARRRHHPNDPLEFELDQERYLDLQSAVDEQDIKNEANLASSGGYNAVAFSYGEPCASVDQKDSDADFCFLPPFPVPEHLIKKLPPTEKVHQIIARTAKFVSTHGGQSEIVLRVKQGDNPSFGFLMPDHDLHPYFRFLVNNKELLNSDIDLKSVEEQNMSRSGLEETGGALSLLGSVYGSGEDEESALGNTLSPRKCNLENAVDTEKTTVSEVLQESDSSVVAAARDETVKKSHISSLKDTPMVVRRNHSINTIPSGNALGMKNGGSLRSVSTMVEKVESSSSSNLYNSAFPILEPPYDIKRVVDKIVEFILRNGKEFEAVLVQQDANYKRFPFLLPSNQYHPYYLKILQNAQEPRLASKSCNSEKPDTSGVSKDKITEGKESDSSCLPSNIPYDSNKKDKFKMVIGKSKKEGTDTSSRASQPEVGVSMDAEAVAAILQAARKGIKNPNLEIFAKNSGSQGPSSEGGESTSLNSLLSSRLATSTFKMADDAVSLAKATAKNAAIAAANEADSSEASLTREQKIKAERLRRAKMFAAMIKNGGAAPLKSEPLHALSVDPPDSGLSRSGASVVNIVEREREREASLVPRSVDSPEKTEMTETADASNVMRSKRMYRARSEKDEDEGEEVREGRDSKHSMKKRRSSHHIRESREHKKRHSSSRRRHRSDSSSSDDEHECSKDHPKRDNSSDDEDRHSRRKYKQSISSKEKQDKKYRHSRSRRDKHDTSPDDEQMHPRHKHKLDDGTSDSGQEQRHSRHHNNHNGDEYRHSRKRVKSNNSEHVHEERWGDDKNLERDVDMGGGVDTRNVIDVSDDLRAKVRAMLATI